MERNVKRTAPAVLVALILFLPTCLSGQSFPRDKLPPYIRRLTDYGERAEWSLDGKKVMFVTRAGGDVMEIDIETKQISPVTLHYERPKDWGYYRALYLSNGDYLLTGGPSRHEAYLQIMDRRRTKPPKVFDDVIIGEGPAVSRKSLKTAFTGPRQEQIWRADIVYRHGEPFLARGRLLIDNRNVVVDGVKYEGMIEPQNFRPPDDKELIWAQYGTTEDGIFTAEVMGYDLETGEITNYSKAPNQYDEPEGIFPSGEYTLVECDHHHPKGNAFIDLYRLELDGTGVHYQRLTHFSDVPGFRASNGVVRDDGRYVAFQESAANSAPGTGSGIYLLDLTKAGLRKP